MEISERIIVGIRIAWISPGVCLCAIDQTIAVCVRKSGVRSRQKLCVVSKSIGVIVPICRQLFQIARKEELFPQVKNSIFIRIWSVGRNEKAPIGLEGNSRNPVIDPHRVGGAIATINGAGLPLGAENEIEHVTVSNIGVVNSVYARGVADDSTVEPLSVQV